MSPPWRLIHPRTASTALPPLLISAEFTSNAYSVSITDLTYLWSESLDRRNIIKRSLDVDTSIDPSEDAQQMSVFLEKIQCALGGAKNTSFSILTQSRASPEEPPPLEINITVELPKGLHPLKWPLHLKPLPQSAFSSQLLFPVLQAHIARMQEVRELVDLMKDKDHVIQKLIEKLEATGAELGHVFPGAAGKGGRNIPRELVEERVRGLRAFDAEEWIKGIRAQEKQDGTEEVAVTIVKAFETIDSHASTHIADRDNSEGWINWWIQVKNGTIEFSTHKAEGNIEAKDGAHSIQGKQKIATQEDDDFQVQSTPPRHSDSPAPKAESSSSPPTIPSQAVITDSTDDEDDLDGPSQHSTIPDSFPRSPPKQQVKRLGTIGRSKAAPEISAELTTRAKIQASSSSKVAKGKPSIIDDDDETATEDEEDLDRPPKASSLSKENPAPPAEPKRAGTLGLIGSKSKLTPNNPLHPPSTNAQLLPPPPSLSRPLHIPQTKSKLGIIGRKGKAALLEDREGKIKEVSSKQDMDGDGMDDIMRGRGDKEMEDKEVQKGESAKQKEQLRETSLERADRKREELKRELGEKAKAPVKKKRKF